MQFNLLRAKLHKACVTRAELQYEGSCAIDDALLATSDIREHEHIEIYNINNGERFTTYVIRAEAGSGTISINGAAARLVQPGDRIIICAYGYYSAQEAETHKPRLVYLDDQNHMTGTADCIPIQKD
jgi:aspartate 1-decarboxylase